MDAERVRAPLFDRLAEPSSAHAEDARPVAGLDLNGLRDSILRELADLFNTRGPHGIRELADRPLSTLDYGLPDYAGHLTRDPETGTLLAEAVRRVVEEFEPRLRNAEVAVHHAEGSERTLVVEIHADICVGGVREPLPLVLEVDERGVFGPSARAGKLDV